MNTRELVPRAMVWYTYLLVATKWHLELIFMAAMHQYSRNKAIKTIHFYSQMACVDVKQALATS